MRLLLTTDSTTRRVLLTVGAALLVVLSSPPFGLWPLAFVALVPLHAALRNAGRRTRVREAAAIGFGFGVLVHLTFFHWLLAVPFVSAHHLAVLAAYLAVFSAVFVVIWSRLSGRFALPLVPAALVALDWIRGHAGFLACPWGTIGQTQSENLPLLQWASVGGEPLITFAVVSVNVAVAELLERGRSLRPIVTLGLVALGHVAGAAMMPATEGRPLRVAAVQPNIDPRAPRSDSDALRELTERAAATRPDLVVWPESTAGDTEHDFLALFRTRAIIDSVGVPVLFGSSSGSTSERGYNSLFFMTPGKPMPQPYRKVRLVPFAEYAPIGPAIGPRMFDTIPGDTRFTFDLDGVDVEPLLCFESLFADDVRVTASARPSVIALAVNDAWFGKSVAPELHNLVSAFRAVENRRPVVIASNGGPSTIFDASGRVVARARSFEPDVIVAAVRVDVPAGPYRRWGDAVPLGLIVTTVLLSFVGPFAERRRSAASTVLRAKAQLSCAAHERSKRSAHTSSS
ncbi:MAG: apolipoprotein N-acyltransferase [Myxococcales bacterium]|nr:apolipoprotein N-acyltransferase [Myxococcales bacterium]